jgi:hypothetical protein
MRAIKVNFQNEQEEKVLLSILDSLNYDYEPEYSSDDESLINQALERSNQDFEAGRTSSHNEVMDRVSKKYGL